MTDQKSKSKFMEFSVKNKFQLKLEKNSVELQRLYVIIWNNKDTGSYNSVRIQDIFMNSHWYHDSLF